MDGKLAPLQETARHLDELITAFEATLRRMGQSPFVRASKQPLTVAVAPYAHLSHAPPGAAVCVCYLYFAVCRKVDVVEAVVPGEILGTHPFLARPSGARWSWSSLSPSLTAAWPSATP